MKFTLSWLKVHLDTNADLDTISKALTAVGLEVENVEDRAKIYAPFKTAKVISAERHPDADKLQVLMVDPGDGKALQVVCGAPNARAGMVGVFAPEGSYIPGLDVTLKKSKIRGVESNGMMVSEREMMLSDEHKGIIDLPADTKIGIPMAPLFGLDDPVIEINLTPNRADCAGVRGIARDLAAKGLGTLKPLMSFGDITPAFDTPITVSIQDTKACPQFLGRLIKGVKNGPSPEWLQARMKSIGLRSISTLVDITNLFTIGLNRPLHVFDADKIKGNIEVRLSKGGEKLDALNDKTYELAAGMTVVCDDSGVLGLGGIVGGTSTGVSDTTTNVYVECAYFDPVRTAMTGRALQINSDARYRFERGIDPAFLPEAMELAADYIVKFCGGTPGSVVSAGAEPAWKRTILFDPSRTQKLTGLPLSHQEDHHVLVALGFTVDAHTIPWKVTPPSWRPDIEGSADLVEEIIRIHGFDAIKPVSMTRDGMMTSSALSLDLKRRQDARRALAARGLMETVSWSFMKSSQAVSFEAVAMNDNKRNELTLTNAISSEMDRMRPSILPNLLQAAQRNADRGFANAALFEIGPVFTGTAPDDQFFSAAGIRHMAIGDRDWLNKDAHRAVSAYDAKADALAALEACGMAASKVQISTDAPSYYHPGRSATIRQGKEVLGWFGELHPSALEALDVKGPACGFEVFLSRIPAPKKTGTAKPLLKPSAFQPISRDFAFIVNEDVAADTITKTAALVSRDLIDRVNVFDVYAGKGVEPGKKSVAITVILQPREKTLTDAEIESLTQNIVKAVADKTGASLRA